MALSDAKGNTKNEKPKKPKKANKFTTLNFKTWKSKVFEGMKKLHQLLVRKNFPYAYLCGSVDGQ
jgi:hypothetical protein